MVMRFFFLDKVVVLEVKVRAVGLVAAARTGSDWGWRNEHDTAKRRRSGRRAVVAPRALHAVDWTVLDDIIIAIIGRYLLLK